MNAGPMSMSATFFFQAEDGIRDGAVTGVQTCALPIYVSFVICELSGDAEHTVPLPLVAHTYEPPRAHTPRPAVQTEPSGLAYGGENPEIGRASCRERARKIDRGDYLE